MYGNMVLEMGKMSNLEMKGRIELRSGTREDLPYLVFELVRDEWKITKVSIDGTNEIAVDSTDKLSDIRDELLHRIECYKKIVHIIDRYIGYEID